MHPEPEAVVPAPDPERPVRLLHAERDTLLPGLDSLPAAAFDLPTACAGWSVRDVLAHCAAALSRVIADDLHAFTPDLNELDVSERRQWPLGQILAELASGYEHAGAAMAAARGELDVIALGEWLHGGDVRAALGQPLAYASAGFDDACALLADWARRSAVPLVEANLAGGTTLRLGIVVEGRPQARLITDNATLMRLFAGRPADPKSYQLTGATADELIVF
jgi:uncharacterized protein (TIGR03083 family)